MPVPLSISSGSKMAVTREPKYLRKLRVLSFSFDLEMDLLLLVHQEQRPTVIRMPPAFFISSKNAYTTASRGQLTISGSP